MSLLKLPLLLSLSISYHFAHYRTSYPDPEDKIIATSTRERIWKDATLPCIVFLQGTMWLTTVAESIVIIGSLEGTPRSSDTMSAILNALGPAEASKLTVPFVLGAILVTAGGLLRVQCYHTMGRYFTFEQCIRKEHKLVTTGPYAVVRHPGYTGICMCILGSCIVYGAAGSWLRASGMLSRGWVRAVAVGWCLLKAAVLVTLFRRSAEEDQFLSERFGKEWESWAGRVKYKLVPLVY